MKPTEYNHTGQDSLNHANLEDHAFLMAYELGEEINILPGQAAEARRKKEDPRELSELDAPTIVKWYSRRLQYFANSQVVPEEEREA